MIVSAILMWIYPKIEVIGDSMYPTFIEGESVRGRRLFFKRHLKSGKVYIVRLHDEYRGTYFVIKRLDHIKDGKCWFLGDNAEVSCDSRNYGYVDPKQVVAVVYKKESEVK
jgi:hypothetical protein